MIACLKGRLLTKTPQTAVIDTGGVGWEVHIPKSTYQALPAEGERAFLHIKTIVREESIDLYGFLSPGEKEAFVVLNSVSKIGPRLALTILSDIEPLELAQAVLQKDVGRLSRISGIGAKTAERLAVELKDRAPRLASLAGAGQDRALPAADLAADNAPWPQGPLADTVSALLNLGYHKAEAERAARKAAAEAGAEAELGRLLRLALKTLKK